MDKLGDDSAAKFINALIKSVQTLCHGYLDFQTGVEIIGHINLSVDKGNSLDYILKEKVSKNAENSTLFISSSFHAEPKPEQDVSGKTPENQTSENSEITDSTESGRVSSAISSISSALTASKERERSRQSSSSKDFSSLHSHRYQNTAKRKASFDENGDFRPAKVSYHDQLSDVTSESSYHQRPSSPIDSKEALRALKTANFGDVSETVLPQTANVRTESCDIGVNLAGSVLEPVEESQNNPDLPEREEDSDNDLEVTFIKEEYVEGEGSLGDFENSGGQQFTRGPHQRASDGNIDPSLFSLGLHPSSASSTYVPSASSQQYSPGVSLASTSQPQPGTSGMRDQGENTEPISEWTSASWTRLLAGLPLDAGTTVHNIPTSTQMQLAEHLFQAQGFSLPSTDGTLAKSPTVHRKPKSPRLTQAAHDESGNTVFPCGMCNAKFKTSSGLAYHERQNHKDLPQYRCPVCSKGFVSRGHFVGHMNMHNNTKTFECPVCLKTFAYMSSLKFHLKMHNNAQVFECTVCAKKFVYEKSYKMHLNTHNRANAFSCAYCPKKFAYRSSLQYHLKTGCKGDLLD